MTRARLEGVIEGGGGLARLEGAIGGGGAIRGGWGGWWEGGNI